MQTLHTSVRQENEFEKIKEADNNHLLKGEVSGSDVISVIRYYCRQPGTDVQVTTSEGTKCYSAQDYNQYDFDISIDAVFTSSCSYEGIKLVKVIYIQKT